MKEKNDRKFQVLVKPVGARCKLRCTYYYYPDREELLPGRHILFSFLVCGAGHVRFTYFFTCLAGQGFQVGCRHRNHFGQCPDLFPPFVPVIAGALKNREVILTGLVIGIAGYAVGNYIGVFLAYLMR